MSGTTGQSASADEVVTAQLSFPTPWAVDTDDEVPAFRLKVPALTLQGKDMPATYKPPDYLRLDIRRRKFPSRLRPRPVLRSLLADGSNELSLLVPKSLESTIADSGDIPVTPATKRAFRWYRFTRSAGPPFSAVASIIGGLLVALGTAWLRSGTGKGLLIAGAALTFLAAAGMVISAWRAPAEA
jgi:hypothetical protein